MMNRGKAEGTRPARKPREKLAVQTDKRRKKLVKKCPNLGRSVLSGLQDSCGGSGGVCLAWTLFYQWDPVLQCYSLQNSQKHQKNEIFIVTLLRQFPMSSALIWRLDTEQSPFLPALQGAQIIPPHKAMTLLLRDRTHMQVSPGIGSAGQSCQPFHSKAFQAHCSGRCAPDTDSIRVNSTSGIQSPISNFQVIDLANRQERQRGQLTVRAAVLSPLT